jgi:membrane-bound lytic murein transglycosylase A
VSRRAAVLLVLIVLVLAAVALRLWLASRQGGEGLASLLDLWPGEDRLVLKPATFEDLPGWREDAVDDALPAGAALGQPWAGTAGDWRQPCAEAARLPREPDAVRGFFESRFRPWTVRNHRNPMGLFTGYYEPLLHGSRKRRGKFKVPIYTRPPDLVLVDLGRFRDDLKGRRIAGQVKHGALVPFPDRRAIDRGALAGRKLELVWVDDPISAFFLQVQGSGRVRLAEGGELRLGYAAQNGHPYRSIGREMIERGILTRDTASMQSIRAWLETHPDRMKELLEKDASYVFFQEVKGEGPLGAEGVPLTPGRSLAVDLKHMPLGVPLWLSSRMPAERAGEPDPDLHRLFIAQDTGGAIRGIVRGDLFWGFGIAAESRAGRMKHRGRYWVLLPKAVTPS